MTKTDIGCTRHVIKRVQRTRPSCIIKGTIVSLGTVLRDGASRAADLASGAGLTL